MSQGAWGFTIATEERKTTAAQQLSKRQNPSDCWRWPDTQAFCWGKEDEGDSRYYQSSPLLLCSSSQWPCPGRECHTNTWPRQWLDFLKPLCRGPVFPPLSGPPWESASRLGQWERRIPFSIAPFHTTLDTRTRWESFPPARLYSRGHTGCFGQMLAPGHPWPPCRAPAHLAQLCRSFRTNPQECPFQIRLAACDIIGIWEKWFLLHTLLYMSLINKHWAIKLIMSSSMQICWQNILKTWSSVK